jgi:hypothetical protein
MKWGEYNEAAVERVTGWLGKTVGARVLYALMILSAFVLMSGANEKWGG